MIGAEVEHGIRGKMGTGAEAPAPHWQLRCGVSRPAPRHGLSSQRGACLLPAAYSAAGGFGVLDEAIGDRRGDGGVVENVAPVGEGRVGGDDGGAFVTVTGGDHLVKEIGALLVQR